MIIQEFPILMIHQSGKVMVITLFQLNGWECGVVLLMEEEEDHLK